MSWPAENAWLPAPVRTRTSVFGSTASSSSASSISRWTCGLMALRLSGRLIISQVMPLSFSAEIASYFLPDMVLLPLCEAVAHSTGDVRIRQGSGHLRGLRPTARFEALWHVALAAKVNQDMASRGL